MTTPIFHSFNELQLGPAMAQTQAGPVAISESSIQGDPVIRYQLRTTASSRVQTTDIPGSIDSTSLRFRFIKRLSNKHVEFHGNGFVVTFRNKITRKTCCDCSNAVPCSVRTMDFAIIPTVSNRHVLAHLLGPEPIREDAMPPADHKVYQGHLTH